MRGTTARAITVVAVSGLLMAGSGGVASASPAGRTAAASSQAIPRPHVCHPGPLGFVGELLDSLAHGLGDLLDGL